MHANDTDKRKKLTGQPAAQAAAQPARAAKRCRWLLVLLCALAGTVHVVGQCVPASFSNKTIFDGLGINQVNGVFASGSTVYAATEGGGLAISTNGGASFSYKTTAEGLGNNDVRGVFASGSTVYAGTFGGLSISTNGGTSFSTKTTADGLGSNFVLGVFASGSTVYAATQGGLSIGTCTPPCVPSNPIVTTTADNGAGSLRQAILDACPGSTITFSVSGTITLNSTLPPINNDLTIDGTGRSIIVSGNNSVQVMIVNSGKALTLLNLTIANGKCGCRGGGIVNFGTLTVTNSTFSGNSVGNGDGGADGGGIENDGGTVNVTNSTFTGNSAYGGGGIENRAGTVNVTNSTFSDNNARLGGGIYNRSTANVTNSTFSGNSADPLFGGGILTSGTLNFANTIIANSSSGVDCANLGTIGTNKNNLVMDGSCSPALSGDPKLGPLQNNGGPTQTMALLAGSPALNAGDNCVVQNPGCLTTPLTTDQRGAGFPRKFGSQVDIGAFEVQCSTILAAISGGGAICPNGTAQIVVNVSGGSAPYTVTLSNGSTQPGASNQTQFSFNVGAAGVYTVQAGTDANGCPLTGQGSATVTLNAATAINTPPANQTRMVNQSVTFNIAATGTNLTYQWRKNTQPIANATQSSLTINAVSFADAAQYDVVVTGACGVLTSAPATLTVTCQTINVTNPATTTGAAGVPFNQTFTQTGGIGATTFSTTSALPSGLTLAPNGMLSGTPLQTGTFPLTVKATDSNNCTGMANYTLTIACPAFTLAALPQATAGALFNATLSANPAGGNYQFSSADKPAWLTLASTGGLSGTPPSAGTFSFNVNVTGFGVCTQMIPVTLVVICPNITLGTLANGVQGTAYSQTLTASPAGTTYSFALASGTLPPGLTLASNGTLNGTPSAPGNFAFAIMATGWGGCAKTQAYNLLITGTCAPITISPATATLPGATLGTAYPATTLTATGGIAPYTFSVASGALPPGLSLSSAGALSGTPATGGTFVFTIRATAQGGCTGSRGYVLTVACATLTFNPPSLPNGTVGQNYNQPLSLTPAGTYTFSLLLGQLPLGYTMNSAGVISGVTNQTGTYNFTVKALGGTCQATKSYTIVIGAGLAALAQTADYDGDGKSDPALWSAKAGTWQIVRSSDGQNVNQRWGTAGDVTLLGDYDGDGQTDLAVFRPSDGAFYVKRSSDGSVLTKAWGLATDVPVPGDYDGDGKTDIAVWRGSEGNWYIVRSSDGAIDSVAWGAAYAPYDDVALPGDYDGDGKTDVAVFRRATGTWFIKRSSDGQVMMKAWGLGTDVPVAADYDGDGKTDIAVWRGSTWYIWQSASNSARVTEWGANYAPYFDQAAPGDYDGDGKADLTVWRVSEQAWYIRGSADGAARTVTQGRAGDAPVAASLQR